MAKFICVECGLPKKTSEKVFDKPKDNWCRSCYDKEVQRSIKEDGAGHYMRTRPPKYMLEPFEYKRFGY